MEGCNSKENPCPDPEHFELPPGGLPDEKRKKCLAEFTLYIKKQKEHFLGYQVNQKMDFTEEVKEFLDCHVNNVGDPFIQGNFTMNSKLLEKAVLDYYARLWHAKYPHDPRDPESYWGYVLTMGSTEGNLYGHWTARDYLAGRKLIVDDLLPNKRILKYLKPSSAKEKGNAYTPVAFFSEDTHYSILKVMRVLEIPVFCEIGRDRYPGENPLDSEGKWPETFWEVPSKKGKEGPGSVDIEKLTLLVEFFASKGHPILICCNYGTTFKGAYDNVAKINDTLIPVFKKYGLVNREVEYEAGKTDRRNGYWIHVDGALGASYMPFIEMAHDQGKINTRGPVFDFRLECVNSIVMSGHKWPGAPWPCGVFMTKVKYQVFPPDDPEYIGSPDTTFAGSRSGLSPVILWNFLAKHSYEKQIQLALRCEKLARYTEEKLKELEPYHPSIDLYIERTPLALTVRFRKPVKAIIDRYSLSCESLKIDGEERQYAHIFMMDSVTEELIDALCEDLKAENAFQPEEELSLASGRNRGWR